MILQSLSTIWTAIAAPLGNHLWQSTLIALAAGLLTLLLRKNHAQIRYLLWLAASLKFLLPFSLLVTLGAYLSKSHTSTASSAGLYVVIDQVSQPFAPSVSIISPAAPSTLASSLFRLLPVLLFVWLCGFAAVLLVGCIRWRRVAASTRSAAPLREGRELETLRRLQGIAPTLQDIDLRLSAAHLEPGIFGIVRSVLIWPQGISDLLGDEHLEAIIAHELWHVRRRENLAAALHMLVEAFFWFHPLVWWIGARLLHERERACDESVLASGGNRHIYAESILKICEFCVTSPLPCISGVTGADLKRRISRIMTGPVARNLNLSRKLLLGAAASLAIALPIAIGLVNAGQIRASSPSQSAAILTGQSPLGRVGLVPDWQARAGSIPSFEIASLKQNTSGNEFSSVNFSINPGDVGAPTGGLLYGTNVPLISYIYFAYNLTGGQLQLLWPNLPHWFMDDKFDIQVQADGNPTNDQLRLVMQSVLA